MTYLHLIIEFFKIGLFAVGGGAATIPFLMDLIDRYHWYSEKEFTNLIAISESTPGPVGVNMATYSGYLAAGVTGALTATISLVFPSVVIILMIARFLKNFSENPMVEGIFAGIRPAVTGLIATAAFGIIKMTLYTDGVVSIQTMILFAIFFVFMEIKRFQSFHPAVWLLAGAIIGIFLL